MSSIVAPVMTEKSVAGLAGGLYVFAVVPQATKNMIKDDIKKLYGVDAIAVRIVNTPPTRVSFRRKPGLRSATRKAYVQLAAKQQIPGFELPKQKDNKEKDK